MQAEPSSAAPSVRPHSAARLAACALALTLASAPGLFSAQVQLRALLLQALPTLSEQTVAAVVADTQQLHVLTPADLREQLVARHGLTEPQAKAVTDALVLLLMAPTPGSTQAALAANGAPAVDPTGGASAHTGSPSPLPLALPEQRVWPSMVGSPTQAAWLAFVAKHGATLRKRYPGNSNEQVAIMMKIRFEALDAAGREPYEKDAYEEVVRAALSTKSCCPRRMPVLTAVCACYTHHPQMRNPAFKEPS